MVARAEPSPACGQWTGGCVFDPLTNIYLNTVLTLTLYTNPGTSFDPQGSFGSYTSQQGVFSDATCTAANRLATIGRFGEWLDQGPGTVMRCWPGR